MAMATQAMLLATPTSATDLSTLLVQPGAGWVDIAKSPTDLVGGFSAHEYSDYITAVGSIPGTVETRLKAYGFTRGAGLEWVQPGTRDVLFERVFEFGGAKGAGKWFSDIRSGTQRVPEYRRPFDTSGIPNSFGAVLHAVGTTFQYRVDFAKGNLVFVVHMDSLTTDLSTAAIGQAAAEYLNAPSQSHPPHAAGQPADDMLPTVAIVGGGLTLVLALVVTIMAVLLTRGPGPVAPPGGGIVLSPDGAYWWDGLRWRDRGFEVPPTAAVSPDGAYWWDGTAWRPAAR
jgi:hypothetical protein